MKHDERLTAALLRYLANGLIEKGVRELASEAQLAPSTVSRQTRKIKQRREGEQVFDGLLRELERFVVNLPKDKQPKTMKELSLMLNKRQTEKLSKAKLEMEAKRVLRRLRERDAFLLVSPDMPNAAVFRKGQDGQLQRLTVTGRVVAENFIFRDWVEGEADKKLGRYKISSRGEAALKRLLSREAALKATEGFAEAQSAFQAQHGESAERVICDEGYTKRFRVNIAESPLTLLARKRDRSGEPFLSARQVNAGERLREDFEVAQINPRVAQNWERFLVPSTKNDYWDKTPSHAGAEAARKRVQDALSYLGDGLSDVAFRCCCHLEGLEATERKLGWSARSGKIVLRIALDRLAEFYDIPERPSARDLSN